MQLLHVSRDMSQEKRASAVRRSTLQRTVPCLKGLDPPSISHYPFDREFAIQEDIGRSEIVMYSDTYGTALRENVNLLTRTDHVVSVTFLIYLRSFS
jgi:hypothetical protein